MGTYLLNNMCEILKKIINTRLTWYLEKIGCLAKFQNGFRKNKSTINGHACIQTKSLKKSNQ